jgi:hypothetical protein
VLVVVRLQLLRLEDCKARQAYLVQLHLLAVVVVQALQLMPFLAQAVQAAVVHLQPLDLPMVQVEKATLAVQDSLEKMLAVAAEKMQSAQQQRVKTHHFQQALVAQD